MTAAHLIRARDPHGGRRPCPLAQAADEVAAYVEDAAHFPGGHADAVARPGSEAEVAWLVGSAGRILPVGARSSVTGGATPDGGLVLSTERLTTIHVSGQRQVTVGAGVALETLQDVLRGHGWWYAPVPTFTGACAGGVVATNAAGAATFKYGSTRRWVAGLTVVLACGHVLDLVRGAVTADPRDGFRIDCPCGTRRVRPGTYRMPDVPKCSAGYYAAPGMDLIDLFIGSEGTLGIITGVTLDTLPLVPAHAMTLVFTPSEATAIALTAELRDATRQTWQARDPRGLDVAAIESLDRRCLDVLHEDLVDRRCGVAIPSDAQMALLVQLELPADVTASAAFDQLAGALASDAPDTPLTRVGRLLHRYGLTDAAELVLPGDTRRFTQLLAFREGAPTGVNRRVGDARRDVDPRIDKTAADMVVPFPSFAQMMAVYREGFERRGLDYAVWGHLSDGNVHPNLIPTSYDDVRAAREAILEFGDEVIRLGGSPLAEHGVGRSPMKQTLLLRLYGREGIAEMRAVKAVLDPDAKLAPGVLFPARPA